ncbi:MAG: 3-phosphoshikimate 1-carboxyvinyltransferase [Dehalococcoidales bacterium]|nr:3-phosphoshikimate 1-carboxyvinyltransferase [Dehalococcoidales bacterium]
MKASVSKSELSGTVRAPASKSYTIRGLACAALAQGDSEVVSPLISDDTEAALNVLRAIGVKITREVSAENEERWRVTGGSFREPETELFCGDSAATLRFMAAIASLVPGECRLTAGPSLAKRPVGPLVAALRQLGVDCSAQGGLPPLVVKGGGLEGGLTELPGDISSQFVSALLLVAPLAGGEVTIRLTTAPESKPYLLMTLDSLKSFGIKVAATPDLREFKAAPQRYKPARYTVEGDWSSASYFLALGALSGPVSVTNLNPESLQGDRALLGFLREMGAQIEIDKSTITVRKSRLNAIRADLADVIDLLPTVAVLAAVAEGTSEFSGIERARIKESNRVAAVRKGLERMGVVVREEKNRLLVTGATPKGASIESYNDHRIAMAFGVLGTVAGETMINEAECVSKTFPDFWGVLGSIGGEVKQSG